MRIEAAIEGLTKARRNKLSGLAAFDEATGLGTFEWRADEDPPHDYPSAYDRVRTEVEAHGGSVTAWRPLG